MAKRSNPVRVLVVDDDAMSRELLTVLLEAEGYAVLSAESGEAALALLERDQPSPDLVLADVQMPGVAGAELAAGLRRLCGEQALLLAMSGSRPAQETITRFDAFLLKPFKMDQVAAALAALAARADARPKREKWVVVRGPAGEASPKQKLVSIQRPRRSKAASKGGMGTTAPGLPPQGSGAVETITHGEPVLNEKIYQQLAGSMPAQQLQEMYSMCVNDARARIAIMRTLATQHDGAKFVREAHAIKGGCGMLGATQLHGMAAELEKNGLGGGAGTGAIEVNSLDELSAACDRLERMLRSRV